MIALEIFKEALFSLWHHKGRTFLSVLGIVIGISSVITMMALGSGAQQQITDQISTLGTNILSLTAMGNEALKISDMEVILANDYAGLFTGASAEVSSQQTGVVGQTEETVTITGVTASYLNVRAKTVELGSFFTDAQLTNGEKVIVLGPDTAETFFGSVNEAVGQKLKLGYSNYTVIGVMKSVGSNQDDFALMPLSLVQAEFTGNSELSTIAFGLKDATRLEEAKSVIGYTMLDRHDLESVDDADFRMFSATDILETLDTVIQTLTMLLAGIAGISLLVGGIGIMNVMLMSVLERTREIGLRKALGARQVYLIMQFLFEAVLITVLGGLVGLLLGLVACWGIEQLVDFTPQITLSSVLAAMGISTAIGLVFGIYPARRAAKLAPIEALRSE